MAAFSLDNFSLALTAFNKGNELKPSAQFKTWIRKCEAELGDGKATEAPTQPAATQTPVATATIAVAASKFKYVLALLFLDSFAFRHDFFQTATHVTVCIFAKSVKKDSIQVTIKKKQVCFLSWHNWPLKLEVIIQLGEGKEYSLDLDLCGEVVPEESRYDVLSTKIEIKLKKTSTGQWPSLEDSGQGVSLTTKLSLISSD